MRALIKRAGGRVGRTRLSRALGYHKIERLRGQALSARLPIILSLAGTNLGRARWHDLMRDTGLIEHCAYALQVNGPKDKFPEDYIDDFDMARDARIRVKRALHVKRNEPGPFAHVFYDHEPVKDGEHWMLRLTREGYTPTDIEFVKASMRGLDRAKDARARGRHARTGMYYMPRSPRAGRVTATELAAMETASGLDGLFDLVWLNAYWPYGDSRTTVTDAMRLDLRHRLPFVYKAARKAAKKDGGQVALAIHPKWGLPNLDWLKAHLDAAAELGIKFDKIIVWMDLKTNGHANAYANQTKPLVDTLVAFAESKDLR